MKPFEYYQTTVTPQVNSLDYKRVYAYKGGKLIWEGTLTEYRDPMLKLPYGCVQEEVFDKEKYGEHYTKRQKELEVLAEEFKQDLFKAFGVENNPKRERCYNLAYEEGHAYGFSAVYDKFEGLVELIKD